ncbi:hypothetical protein LC55x_0600 [Lysobacter capsici]|nr:hypothetical protein LC55x_0600 [Lysobacter capsici]
MKNECTGVRSKKKRERWHWPAARCLCLYSFLTPLNSFLALMVTLRLPRSLL